MFKLGEGIHCLKIVWKNTIVGLRDYMVKNSIDKNMEPQMNIDKSRW